MKYISVKEFQKGVPRILYLDENFPLMVTRRGVDIAVLIKPDSYGRRKKGDNTKPVLAEGEDSPKGLEAKEEVREEEGDSSITG